MFQEGVITVYVYEFEFLAEVHAGIVHDVSRVDSLPLADVDLENPMPLLDVLPAAPTDVCRYMWVEVF